MKNNKKYFVIILAILLVVVMAFTLTCCNKKKQEKQKQQAEESVQITVNEDFECLEDGTFFYNAGNKENYMISGKFSFKGGAKVNYFDTPDGETLGDEITNLNIQLDEGDNIILVRVSNQGLTRIYKINIYRFQHFTVTFDTPQHEVASQSVLEGECATVPTTKPTKIGHDFLGWDFDFTQPIVENTTIKSLWEVKEYKITFDANGGIIYDENDQEIEQYVEYVKYGVDVSFKTPKREGYQFLGWYNGKSRYDEGKWSGTKDMTLTADWKILSLDVRVASNLAGAGNITGEGKYDYNTVCTLTVSPYNGYRFLGWYKKDELLSKNTTYEITLAKDNVSISAHFETLREDMEPYVFYTDDEINYVITGTRYSYLKEVTIPDCVVGIEAGSFSFGNVESLTIPFIGTSAETATQCKSLSSMFGNNNVPSSLKTLHVTGECYVNSSTFNYWNYIETLIFDDIRKIDSNAFWNMQHLKKVSISDSIEYVGKKIFYSNSQDYTPLYISENVTVYQGGTYFGNEENPYLILLQSLESTCTIHPDTKIIGGGAFYLDGKYSSQTLNVEVPDGVRSIGEEAFYSRYLSSFTFPTALKYIGPYAFYYSYGSSSYSCNTVDLSGTSLKEIGANAFRYGYNLASVVLPDSLETIGNNAFYYCTSLNNITFGSGLETIGDYAFYYCYNLNSATFGSGLETIGRYAFYYCTNLTSLTFGSKLKTIKAYAFQQNYGISRVDFLDSNVTIEDYAFDYCRGLTTVTFGKGLKNITRNAFSSCNNLTTIEFSNENQNFYGTNCIVDKKTDTLIYGTKNAIIPNGVKVIGERAFDGRGLQIIVIPDGVERIEDYAFANNNSLSSVSLPDSLKYAGEYVFESISSSAFTNYNYGYYLGNETNPYVYLKKQTYISSIITLPDGVKCFDERAFSEYSYSSGIAIDISNLGDIDLTCLNYANFISTTYEGVRYRGTTSNPYYMAVGLDYSYSTLNIHDGTKVIGNNAFSYQYFSEVRIPASVEEIGYQAFYCCYNLQNVVFENRSSSQLKKIGGYAFFNNHNLVNINLPSGVEEIGADAFCYCYRLSDITIPGNVKKIGYCAFNNCHQNLKNLTIEEGVEEIEEGAFQNCSNLETITLPKSLKVIGQQAFEWCHQLKTINYAGTIAEWNEISKGNNWYGYINNTITVRCSDGNIKF